MKHHKYEVNSDFLIQPYKQGLCLIKPNGQSLVSDLRVESLNQLSLQMTFSNRDHEFVAMNDRSINAVGASSIKECFSKTPASFSSKAFGAQVLKNYSAVMHAKSMMVIFEQGERCDALPIQAMSFRFPWYTEDQIIGVVNFSLLIDSLNPTGFASSLAELISTGLLGNTQVRPHVYNSDFTRRENEILHYLMQGYTAQGIADILFLSKRTIENHVANMRQKTNTRTKMKLINMHQRKIF